MEQEELDDSRTRRSRINEMADADSDDTMPKRRASDKAGAWADPKTWMTLFGLMLTICTILLTLTIWIAGRMLDQIHSINTNIGALTLSTSNANTAQGIQIGNLIREQDHFRADMREQNAYNFNVNKSLTEMATTMRLRGLSTPNIPEPPKLGGQ